MIPREVKLLLNTQRNKKITRSKQNYVQALQEIKEYKKTWRTKKDVNIKVLNRTKTMAIYRKNVGLKEQY